MIRTVRHLALMVGCLGFGCLARVIVYDPNVDCEIAAMLKDPGATERFAAARAARDRSSIRTRSTHLSPLELEAEAFAKLLDPPAGKIERTEHKAIEVVSIRAPAPPKLNLLGTCVNTENPTQSCALIEDPRPNAEGEDSLGPGPHWVRLNQGIHGLTITHIEDSRIVVQAGQ